MSRVPCVCEERAALIGSLNNKLFITPQLAAAAPLKGEAAEQSNDLVFNVCCQIKGAHTAGGRSCHGSACHPLFGYIC